MATERVPLRRFYGVIHGLAECQDCGWETQAYKNAQANAARHARAHGHFVIGELGVTFEYDGRGLAPTAKPKRRSPR